MAESAHPAEISPKAVPAVANGITYQKCPKCGQMMPVNPGYITWCDHCLWNVTPLQVEEPNNLLEVLHQRMGKRLEQEQFQRVANVSELGPSFTPTKVAAFVVAGFVNSFTLLVFLLGAAIIVLTWLNIAVALIGVIFIVVAWALRPHIMKTSTDNIAFQKQFPALYALANRISDAIGARHVAIIALDNDFSASFSRPGWRRKDTLTIGLPLFTILNPQERVALLAHEIAHGASGDLTSGFLVGAALDSLNEWYRILHPDQLWDSRGSRQERADSRGMVLTGGIPMLIANLVANALLLVLSQIPRFWLVILSKLTFRDHRRAEYLADNLAARAAGTEGALGLLRKLSMGDTVQMSMEHFYLNSSKGELFSALKAQIDRVPQRELDRLDQVEKLADSRLGPMDPPTHYRIDLIKAHVTKAPAVELSEVDNAAVDKEIAQVAPTYEAAVLENLDKSEYVASPTL